MTSPTSDKERGPALGFAAGTSVHTRLGPRPIEQIQVGDWVLSHPVDAPPPLRRRQPQEYTWRRVTAIATARSDSTVVVRYGNFADNLEDSLLAAPAQPIWSKTDGWINSASMRHGQAVVLSFNGNALVLEMRAGEPQALVYALRVEEFDSYFVGRLGAWVRSDGPGRLLPAVAAEPRKSFDFSNPQVLLQIDNFYNDTFLDAGTAAVRRRVAPTAPLPAMQRAIETLRAGYSQVQKRLKGPRLTALCAQPPAWMKESDGLNEILRRQTQLLAEGEIRWGALIQANKLLFTPGSGDSPALLVHSPDGYFDAHPDELRAVGRAMFELKGTNPADPVLKEAAQRVSDDADRYLGFTLPDVFSEREIVAATFMVFRRHIPQGVLTAALFPILTHPSTQAVMIVPAEFWPLDLLVMWSERRS